MKKYIEQLFGKKPAEETDSKEDIEKSDVGKRLARFQDIVASRPASLDVLVGELLKSPVLVTGERGDGRQVSLAGTEAADFVRAYKQTKDTRFLEKLPAPLYDLVVRCGQGPKAQEGAGRAREITAVLEKGWQGYLDVDQLLDAIDAPDFHIAPAAGERGKGGFFATGQEIAAAVEEILRKRNFALELLAKIPSGSRASESSDFDLRWHIMRLVNKRFAEEDAVLKQQKKPVQTRERVLSPEAQDFARTPYDSYEVLGNLLYKLENIDDIVFEKPENPEKPGGVETQSGHEVAELIRKYRERQLQRAPKEELADILSQITRTRKGRSDDRWNLRKHVRRLLGFHN